MKTNNNRSETQVLDLFSTSNNAALRKCEAAKQWAPIFRVHLVREREVTLPVVTTPEDVARVLCDYLKHADREHFVVVLLAANNRIIGINTAHIGSLTVSVVSPREVFKPAVLGNANAIIVAHNHPSGNLEPSRADVRITRQLVEAGKLMGIPVHDSIIIGHGGSYTSLAERGIVDSAG